MAKKVKVDGRLEELIQRVDEHDTEFRKADLSEVSLRDATAPLQAAIEGLRAHLPEIAAKAREFYFAEGYFDGEDYEKVYEGAALKAMYVMMDAHALAGSNTFSDFRSALEELADDLSDLRSYCSEYDDDHGVWKNPSSQFALELGGI